MEKSDQDATGEHNTNTAQFELEVSTRHFFATDKASKGLRRIDQLRD